MAQLVTSTGFATPRQCLERKLRSIAKHSTMLPAHCVGSERRRQSERPKVRAIADRLGARQKLSTDVPERILEVERIPEEESATAAEENIMIEGDACPINENVVWQTLCQEARADANSEPALASYLFSTILAHRSLEDALAFVLANKLRSNVLLDSQLLELFSVQYRRDHSLVKKAQADMQAVATK